MGVRSALGTMARFVVAVMGLYLIVALASLIFVVAARTATGQYPVPENAAEELADLDLMVSVLLAAWFVVEGHSLRRLFAFAVVAWVLCTLPWLLVLGVDALVGALPFDATVFGALTSLVGVVAYLGAYRLVYPDSFARRTRRYGLGG